MYFISKLYPCVLFTKCIWIYIDKNTFKRKLVRLSDSVICYMRISKKKKTIVRKNIFSH